MCNEFSTIPRDVSTISFEMVKDVLPKPESKEQNGEVVQVFPGRVEVQQK